MSAEKLDIIVADINKSIQNASERDLHITTCFHMPITDMLRFGRNIANKLNAIEENFDNDYILLKRNDMYIKLNWNTISNNNIAIYIDICTDLDCIEFY
jgi:hypothetical protein